MEITPFDLAAQQLVELLELVSSFSDEDSAAQSAVERAAAVLEAEVAAVVLDGHVVRSVGFPAGSIPTADLVEIALGRRDSLDLPRLGKCWAIAAELAGQEHSHLVLARSGDEGFSPAEWNLLRGMARILDLSLQMLRTMDSLRQRQRLMEHLYDIQRSISRRMPLQEVLETVVRCVKELLGDNIVGLWLPDPGDFERLLLVANAGLETAAAGRLWRIPLAEAGAAGQAVLYDDLVMLTGYAAAGPALRSLTDDRLAKAMAAPVRENSKVTGSLFTASSVTGRMYTEIDQEILLAFAENVSLALTDAKTLSDMNEAFHDSLTGLASRRLFLDQLRANLTNLDTETRLALLFVDLDGFKQVNDTFGHAVGDVLLVGVAERIQAGLRAGDVAARFGGDEFAVMLRGVSDGQAVAVAERIIQAVALPHVIAGNDISVGASIGISLCAPRMLDAEELIRRADAAMYAAKRNGRGRCEMYASGMELAPAVHAVNDDLRQAIDELVHRVAAVPAGMPTAVIER
jgi:diguanylate cyclase (GGDEF)-like protein